MRKYCYKILQEKIEFNPNSLQLYFFFLGGSVVPPAMDCISYVITGRRLLKQPTPTYAALQSHIFSVYSFTTLGFFFYILR